MFTSEGNLEEHMQQSGHTQGFWKMFTQNEESKVKPVSYSQITKGETVTFMVKDVLEFELTSENKKEENDNALIKERKDHSNTKKTLKAIEVQFMKCKAELRCSEEERERFKIENKDLKAVIDLTKFIPKESVTPDNSKYTLDCEVCEYPFRNKAEFDVHKEKHNKESKK